MPPHAPGEDRTSRNTAPGLERNTGIAPVGRPSGSFDSPTTSSKSTTSSSAAREPKATVHPAWISTA